MRLGVSDRDQYVLIQRDFVDGSEFPSVVLAKPICEYVYHLALMSQTGLDANGMKSLTERLN